VLASSDMPSYSTVTLTSSSQGLTTNAAKQPPVASKEMSGITA
jgi:hypothetical protein